MVKGFDYIYLFLQNHLNMIERFGVKMIIILETITFPSNKTKTNQKECSYQNIKQS